MVKASPFNSEVPQVSYPLGLMYLASYLRSSQPDHEIELLDLRCHRKPLELLVERLDGMKPDIVAISALTAEGETLHRIAAIAKEHDPDSVVIVGGPHITACTSYVGEDGNIDVLVMGEGEETFVELVTAVQEGTGFRGIPGTAVLVDGRVEWGPARELIQDLDIIPYPAWDLVDIDVYSRFGRTGNVKRGRFLPLFTSRGCPFRCYYCCNVFGKTYRTRSAENVIGEVREIVDRFDVRDIEILDDIFNLDLERAKTICRGILDLDLLIAFPNGVRADRLDHELICLLAEAGTTNMAVAIETSSQRLQKKIGKNLDVDRVKQAVVWANEEGIMTVGYFMLGFPTETREEMLDTIEFAVNMDLFFASFFIVTPNPGTPLWDQVMGDTDLSTVRFSEYNVFSGYYNLTDLSGAELRKLQRLAYRRFYWRKKWKILGSLFRLRVDWRNAMWLWVRRMFGRGLLRSKKAD